MNHHKIIFELSGIIEGRSITDINERIEAEVNDVTDPNVNLDHLRTIFRFNNGL